MRCTLCHGTHGVAVQTANLVEGTPRGSVRDVSLVSRSCLRCHDSADARASDAVFAEYRRREEPAPPRSFLHDLSDDHPVAQAGGQPNSRRRAARWVTGSSLMRRRASPITTEMAPLPECTSCHEVHDGPDPVLSDEPQEGLCLDCHGSADYATEHVDLGCTSCHAMHGGRDVGLLRESTTDLLCRSCHDPAGGGGLRTGITPPLVPDLQRHAGNNPGGGGDCVGCHPVHR